MNNKPKIAFCFSGQARTLDQTYSFFQKNLFDTVKEQGFDYDIFCTVEDDKDVDKVNLLNPIKVKKIKSSEVEKIIEEKYGDFIRNEFPIKYSHAGTERATFNLLQQYYKVGESFKLKIEYEKENNLKYDIALRIRFDAPFPNKLNFKEILNEIRGNDNNLVICNKHKKSIVTRIIGAESIDDIYFIMSNNASNVLANIFDDWMLCFKGQEIMKNTKIHKIFNKIFDFQSKYIDPKRKKLKNPHAIIVMALIFECPLIFFYTKFFKVQDSERGYYSFFRNHCINIIKTQISIWIIKNSKRLSVTGKFKKSKYEL